MLLWKNKTRMLSLLRGVTYMNTIEGGKTSKIIAEDYSRHRNILPLYELHSWIDSNSWVAPTATIVGEVFINSGTSIWYNVVIRGDINRIRIGRFVSIGENTVIHTCAALPTGVPAEIDILNFTIIGNHCSLYSCQIGQECVIGDRCVVLQGAKMEKGSMLAPGSVVPPGRFIPAGELWAGNPVEFVRELDQGESFANYSLAYVKSTEGMMHKATFQHSPNGYLKRPSTRVDVDPNDDPQEEIDINALKFAFKDRYV